MVVVLGPDAASSVNYGSSTSSRSIPQLMRPLLDHDPGKWVAGHLLNDNLGGPGTDSCNLTPLTQTANKNHASYEGYVKNMCFKAGQYHSRYKNSKYWYGVEYSVAVSVVSFGDFAPYASAPSHITISGRVVRVNKTNGAMTVVPHSDRYASDPANFAPVVIDNDDSHL
jgi:hypothetical protein